MQITDGSQVNAFVSGSYISCTHTKAVNFSEYAQVCLILLAHINNLGYSEIMGKLPLFSQQKLYSHNTIWSNSIWMILWYI